MPAISGNGERLPPAAPRCTAAPEGPVLQEIFAAVQKAVPDARCAALRPSRAPNAPANPAEALSRIKIDVGYEPEYTIETGIADYIEWLQSHPQ